MSSLWTAGSPVFCEIAFWLEFRFVRKLSCVLKMRFVWEISVPLCRSSLVDAEFKMEVRFWGEV